MISRSRFDKLPCAALVCRLVVFPMLFSASSSQEMAHRRVTPTGAAVLRPDAPSRQLAGDGTVGPSQRPPLSHMGQCALLARFGFERLAVRGQLAPHRDLARALAPTPLGRQRGLGPGL